MSSTTGKGHRDEHLRKESTVAANRSIKRALVRIWFALPLMLVMLYASTKSVPNFPDIGFVSSPRASSPMYRPPPLHPSVKLALLVSFPNSGTSYTLSLTRTASNTSTATNYCEVDKEYVPIFGGDVGGNGTTGSYSAPGPIFIPSKKAYSPPDQYILTKTHCSGYCDACRPNVYRQTAEQFRTGCLTTCNTRATENGAAKYTYNSSMVGKVVHLFRDPFDNVISRFHLHIKSSASKNREDASRYESNPRGFQAFCGDVDSKWMEEEAEAFGMDYVETARGVPCHADFFRYVQWHNLAFKMTENLTVPTFFLHYEDYQKNFNGTVRNLLNFLEQPYVNEGPAYFWSNYSLYYSGEQRRAARLHMKKYASPRTWDQLKRYGF